MLKIDTDFDYTGVNASFMAGVKDTLVRQDDFRGIGGHGLLDHGPHGLHRQTSIGIGERTTVNFRELEPDLSHLTRPLREPEPPVVLGLDLTPKVDPWLIDSDPVPKLERFVPDFTFLSSRTEAELTSAILVDLDLSPKIDHLLVTPDTIATRPSYERDYPYILPREDPDPFVPLDLNLLPRVSHLPVEPEPKPALASYEPEYPVISRRFETDLVPLFPERERLMPRYEPPPLSGPSYHQFEPTPTLCVNSAQEAFYNPPGMMNAAQREFWCPPADNMNAAQREFWNPPGMMNEAQAGFHRPSGM